MRSSGNPVGLGERIRQARKKAGFKQTQVAQELGCTNGAVSQWETQATIPEIGFLIGMAKMFGVSIGWLINDDEKVEADIVKEETTIEKKTGEPAFPSHGSIGEVVHEGMTMRDYFAAKAMQKLIGEWIENSRHLKQGQSLSDFVAGQAYAYADSMLKVRKL